jgi:hypothetical protein
MIKRRYYDFRQGVIVLAPFLGLSNFMMLAYLTISEIIPLWLFAPIFITVIIVGFTVMGAKFRKIQFSTDLDLGFERAKMQGGVFYEIMKTQKNIMEKLEIAPDDNFNNTLNQVKNIASGNIPS